MSDAIAVPSTNVLKKSSCYRIRVARSARSAELRWRRGGKASTFPHSNLSNVQAEGRQQRRTHLSKIDHARLRGRLSMEHRGVEYRIIQGIQRDPWKWSVETGTGTKSGISDSKDAAMAAAKRAIDNALDPKKRKLIPPAN